MSKLTFSSAISVLVLHLALCGSLAAQNTQGYVFGGAATVSNSSYTYWQGHYAHFGAGAEGALGSRFTLAGEAAALINTGYRFGRDAVVFSAGPNFHFFPRSDRKIDPFAGVAASLFVSHGAALMISPGGGVNYWFHPRVAARIEFRDYIWVTEGNGMHFPAIRFGISLR